jgi:hypothetical protein
MADSAQADVQHQAVVTLTKLSTKAEYKAALMNRAAVETMARLLLKKDAHVRRCAVTVLSDLVDGVGQNEVSSSCVGTKKEKQHHPAANQTKHQTKPNQTKHTCLLWP